MISITKAYNVLAIATVFACAGVPTTVAQQPNDIKQLLELEEHRLKMRAWLLAGHPLAEEAGKKADAAKERPIAVPVEFSLGEAQFFNGDYIKINDVTSTGDGFEIGATVTVSGTYTLNSVDNAKLCFFSTEKLHPGEKPNATPVTGSQRVKATRGEHVFQLSKVIKTDGGPHLSFYDTKSGSAFGGVYFGDKSNVWMKKGWSYDAPELALTPK